MLVLNDIIAVIQALTGFEQYSGHEKRLHCGYVTWRINAEIIRSHL